MGSALESQAAAKSPDEPLRKSKTQSPTSPVQFTLRMEHTQHRGRILASSSGVSPNGSVCPESPARLGVRRQVGASWVHSLETRRLHPEGGNSLKERTNSPFSKSFERASRNCEKDGHPSAKSSLDSRYERWFSHFGLVVLPLKPLT